MNIFEKYRKLIFNILNNLDSKNILELPEHLNSINVDIPPSKSWVSIPFMRELNLAICVLSFCQKTPFGEKPNF